VFVNTSTGTGAINRDHHPDFKRSIHTIPKGHALPFMKKSSCQNMLTIAATMPVVSEYVPLRDDARLSESCEYVPLRTPNFSATPHYAHCLANKHIYVGGNSVGRHWVFLLDALLSGRPVAQGPQAQREWRSWQKSACGSGHFGRRDVAVACEFRAGLSQGLTQRASAQIPMAISAKCSLTTWHCSRCRSFHASDVWLDATRRFAGAQRGAQPRVHTVPSLPRHSFPSGAH
jgi:hypothetical protein